MPKYSLVRVEDLESWDVFVEKSFEGTIFSSSDYIRAVGKPYELFYVMQGNQQKAGLSLTLSADRSGCILDDLIVYNGILFNCDPSKKPVKSRMERVEITEFIIEELDKRYLPIEMALAPQFEDMRPFLWHKYHSTSSEKMYSADLRYTSYLDISELSGNKNVESTRIFQNLDTLRRRNIREGQKKGAKVVASEDIQLLLEFYVETLKNQNQTTDAEKLERMENLVKSLFQKGLAFMYSAKNSVGVVGYVTLFCKDSKRAYYLFGAGHTQVADRYLGTLAFWDAFGDLARNKGVKQVDLEGVNSPNRGWFKLSFGGDLRSYYQVYKPHNRFNLHR